MNDYYHNRTNEQYLADVEHYCEGLHISVGCKGEQCEHAVIASVECEACMGFGCEACEGLGSFDERDPEHLCEPSFSRSQCDSCGSTLGGDREQAFGIPYEWKHESGVPLDEVLIPLDICVDCVLFHANGDLPNH